MVQKGSFLKIYYQSAECRAAFKNVSHPPWFSWFFFHFIFLKITTIFPRKRWAPGLTGLTPAAALEFCDFLWLFVTSSQRWLSDPSTNWDLMKLVGNLNDKEKYHAFPTLSSLFGVNNNFCPKWLEKLENQPFLQELSRRSRLSFEIKRTFKIRFSLRSLFWLWRCSFYICLWWNRKIISCTC